MTERPGRRDAILAAAFAEFAAKGFRGATIKSIALAAGVQSPARFIGISKEAPSRRCWRPTRDILARSPMPPRCSMSARRSSCRAWGGPIWRWRAARMSRGLFRLLLMEAIERPAVAQLLLERGPLRVLGFLMRYLSRQIALGRLRPHDVRASARAFGGMLISQVLLTVVFPGSDIDKLSNEEHLQACVDIFLRGLLPDDCGADAGAER